MTSATRHAPDASMAVAQGATPPRWLHRSRAALLRDVIGGWPQVADRVRQLLALVVAFFRPRMVRARLERLRALGHIEVTPTNAQILVAARDQMFMGAIKETEIFYRSQGIPWIFHNLRRFISGPATVLDPAGLFSSRDTIVHHVLQTFHRHPVYDLVLLRAFPDGLQAMETQARQLLAGTHRHQRALASLIEDGSYHQRLLDQVQAFRKNPFVAPAPIPAGLVDDAALMLAMDQFKDLRGFTNYAARLPVDMRAALSAWARVAWNATVLPLVSPLLGWVRGRLRKPSDRRGTSARGEIVRIECCDADLVGRWFPPPGSEQET